MMITPILATAVSPFPILVLVVALCFGAVVGAGVAYLYMEDHLRAAMGDAENHRHTSMRLSQKLAAEREKVADLEEQVEGLFHCVDSAEYKDPADHWKRSDDVHLDPRYRDIQFPPPEHEA